METWRRFRSLSGRDRRMVVEAAVLLLLVRAGLSLLSFNTLRRTLRYYSDRPQPARPSSALVPRVAWAVMAAARRLPIHTTCLVESLAGDAMLRRRGFSPQLRFGVRPPNRGALAAHAWVEHDGTVVFGALDELPEYSVLSPRSSDPTVPTTPTRPTRPS